MDAEIMTDKQMKTILEMVKEIVDSSETVEEASKKIEKLLETYNSEKARATPKGGCKSVEMGRSVVAASLLLYYDTKWGDVQAW